MGGANSRLNAPEGEVVPAKFRSMIVGRFDELKNRRNGEATLSKKQLLKHAEEEDVNSQSSHENETTEDKVSPPKKIQQSNTEKISRVVPMPNSECETEEEEKDTNNGNIEEVNKHIDPNQDQVIHANEKVEAEVKTEEGNTAEPVEEPESKPKPENEQEVGAKSDDDDSDDDDGDDDKEREELNRFLYPRSPSFRIYCIEPEQGKEEECKSPTIAMHQKSPSADSVETAASRNTNETLQDQVVETESTTKRKGNKTKKFRAVKSLLNVKSCYYPMCTCAGDDKSRVVVAKAAN